jgi:hypothetical protein
VKSLKHYAAFWHSEKGEPSHIFLLRTVESQIWPCDLIPRWASQRVVPPSNSHKSKTSSSAHITSPTIMSTTPSPMQHFMQETMLKSITTPAFQIVCDTAHGHDSTAIGAKQEHQLVNRVDPLFSCRDKCRWKQDNSPKHLTSLIEDKATFRSSRALPAPPTRRDSFEVKDYSPSPKKAANSIPIVPKRRESHESPCSVGCGSVQLPSYAHALFAVQEKYATRLGSVAAE